MTSIFEGQPPKTRPFPIKPRVIWVLGTLTCIWLIFMEDIGKSTVRPIEGLGCDE